MSTSTEILYSGVQFILDTFIIHRDGMRRRNHSIIVMVIDVYTTAFEILDTIKVIEKVYGGG
jgi:hypothetical protein